MSENKQPINLKERKPIDMPTRERLLALIKIIQSFDKTDPLLQTELSNLLDLFYYNYILRKCLNEFETYEGEYAEEVIWTIRILMERNEEEINETVTFDENASDKSDIFELPQDYSYLNDMLSPELIEVIEDFASENNITSDGYHRKLLESLAIIKDNINADIDPEESPGKRQLIGQATITQDLRSLQDGGILKKSGKSRLYGLSAHKSLDLWQLKIIYELVNSIRFLNDKERQDILDTILHVTSKAKHDQAVEICHPLDSSLYSRTSDFSSNLQKLLEIQLKILEKEKSNSNGRTSATVRFRYRHSRVDKNDRTPDKPEPVTCFPVDIVAKDGFFYLLGAGERGITAYRVDRIMDPEYIDMDFGYALRHPEYSEEKELFYLNNTNNFPGGEPVDVEIKWDFNVTKHYTALFDIFGYENISQGSADDQFIIKTRDNYGMYLNLLRLGPVIEVVGPPEIRRKYSDMVRQMYERNHL